MEDTGSDLSATQLFAILHARQGIRDDWSLLIEFDNRLMTIATKGQEPVLKQLRYAWWREQLAKDSDTRPKGEPLLARLALADRQTEIIEHMKKLIDAWDTLVAEEDQLDAVLNKTADLRAEAIFGSYAVWAGVQPDLAGKSIAEGRIWALASVGRDFDEQPKLLPSSLKPLNLLLISTLLDRSDSRIERILGSLRLNFHAVTGL